MMPLPYLVIECSRNDIEDQVNVTSTPLSDHAFSISDHAFKF